MTETANQASYLTQAAFDRLKGEIETELGDVLRRIDAAEAAEHAEIDRQLAALRAAPPASSETSPP